MLYVITGILLIISFTVFIVFAVRGGNLTVGFFILTIFWAILSRVPFNIAIEEIFTNPVLEYGKTIVYVILGSWFGRVLVDTGVAKAISNETKNISQKNPILATIFISLIITLIFSSAYGVGSAIAIGVILFPILFSIGVPKNVAVTIFTMSIGAAMYLNPILFNQFLVFFNDVKWGPHYLKFGFVAMAIQSAITILMILKYRNQIRQNNHVLDEENKVLIIANDEKLSWITYSLPILPILMTIFLKWDPVPALILVILLTFLLTGKMKSYSEFIELMNQTIHQAISDISELIIMLLVLTMFQSASVHVMSNFSNVFAQVIPHSKLILTFVMIIIAPLAYFRGPIMLFGAGAATVSVLLSTGLFDSYFIFGLFVVPTLLSMSADITQSWNLWAVTFTDLNPKKFLKTAFPWAWLAAGLNLIAAYCLL